MEELSIEEKAKRYDEALKILHKYDGANIMFSQSLKEEMFPELAESKDERIRKELSAYFAKFKPNDMWDADFSFGDIVDWFEKQGKNNMGISEATKQKLEDNLNKALEKETTESWNEFLEKQGEQKPADETPYPETLEKAIDLYYYSYGNGEGEFEHLSLEKFRDIVHTFVSDYGQKPAWSEEDERIYQSIMDDTVQENQLDSKQINWLKSIKGRYTWKPSEEQMEALVWCKSLFTDPKLKSILESLINELKKLKE